MDQGMFILLWTMSGALLGGVVTPLLAENKRRANEWVLMIAGLGLGIVGNAILLAPLWVYLHIQPERAATGPAWQADALSLEQAQQRAEASLTPWAAMEANLWPQPREHTHRYQYVGVFVALALITAVEVALTYIDLSFSIVGLLVALSAAKVLLVVMYFMHLRFDNQWYTAVFAFALPFAGIVLAVLAVA
jgi:cytochrome c oxidase subunit IV